MSEYVGEIRAVTEVSQAHEDMLEAFGRLPGKGPDRHDAMAHFLSGEEGWRDARTKLRGTFAKPSRGGKAPATGANE